MRVLSPSISRDRKKRNYFFFRIDTPASSSAKRHVERFPKEPLLSTDIARRRLTASSGARAYTHTRLHTDCIYVRHAHSRTSARAHIYASAGWRSRPRVIVTYTGYTRDEGNDDSRNGTRLEKGPRRREIAWPPGLRVASHSLRSSLVAAMTDPYKFSQ